MSVDLVAEAHAASALAELGTLVRLGPARARAADRTDVARARQVTKALEAIDLATRARGAIGALFTPTLVLVDGQPLRGSRAAHVAVLELGERLRAVALGEIELRHGIGAEALDALCDHLAAPRGATIGRPFEAAGLVARELPDAVLRRGVEPEPLGDSRAAVRVVATAVVAARALLGAEAGASAASPRRLRRVALSLVALVDRGGARAVAGLAPPAGDELAFEVVLSAVFAAALARGVLPGRGAAVEAALAALSCAATSAARSASPVAPPLAALEVSSLGPLDEARVVRAAVVHEALARARFDASSPRPTDVRAPSLRAESLAVARAAARTVVAGAAAREPSPLGERVAAAAALLASPREGTLLRALAAELGVVPTRTVVRLASGEAGDVVDAPEPPRARVRVYLDDEGRVLEEPREVEVSLDAPDVRVLSTSRWGGGLGAARADVAPASERPPASLRPRLPSFSEALAPFAGSDPPVPPPPRPPDSGPEIEALEGLDADAPAEGTSSGRLWARGAGRLPNATGTLGATPLPHVLAHVLERRLDGTLLLLDEAGEEHGLGFEAGALVRLDTPAAGTSLASRLVRARVLGRDEAQALLDEASALGIRVDELARSEERVPAADLARALEAEALDRLARLAELGPETELAFFRDASLVPDAAPVELAHPVSAVLAAVRAHPDRARVHATLRRLAQMPLVLHPEARLEGLALSPGEADVLAALRDDALTYGTLARRAGVDREELASLVYAFAITHQLLVGRTERTPLGADGPRSKAPAAPSRAPAVKRPPPSLRPKVRPKR